MVYEVPNLISVPWFLASLDGRLMKRFFVHLVSRKQEGLQNYDHIHIMALCGQPLDNKQTDLYWHPSDHAPLLISWVTHLQGSASVNSEIQPWMK